MRMKHLFFTPFFFHQLCRAFKSMQSTSFISNNGTTKNVSYVPYNTNNTDDYFANPTHIFLQ